MEENIKLKKVDERLLQKLVEVIASSHTQLTFLQQQELFQAVGQCEAIEDAAEEKEEV